MIRYTLQCAAGHRFESWFPSSSSYESQRERGFVTCPDCGSSAVDKAIMAPSVARTDRPRASVPTEPAPAPLAEAPAPETPLPVMSQPEAELRSLMRKLREHVVKTSDYVGTEFADLARKMHEGEVEHRAIYGEASADEVKALHEDDIEVFPLPLLPEDRN
ncbi:DUF1178 family protein [Xanthobacter sp. ZOL 2024]